MNFLLPITIFLAWLAFTIVPAGKLAIEDTRKRVPADKRRGTSILPIFPIFPAIIWGSSFLLGRYVSPMIIWIVIGLHAALLVGSSFVIIRDIVILRRLKT